MRTELDEGWSHPPSRAGASLRPLRTEREPRPARAEVIPGEPLPPLVAPAAEVSARADRPRGTGDSYVPLQQPAVFPYESADVSAETPTAASEADLTTAVEEAQHATATSFSFADSDPSPTETGNFTTEWDDEPEWLLAEPQPEDEIPVLAESPAEAAPTEAPTHEAEAPSGQAVAIPPADVATLAALTDQERIQAIAGRLERIARLLRERGSAAPLVEQATDPLGALITGYLIGFFEATGGHEHEPE